MKDHFTCLERDEICTFAGPKKFDIPHERPEVHVIRYVY